jgi:hypothetical protein
MEWIGLLTSDVSIPANIVFLSVNIVILYFSLRSIRGTVTSLTSSIADEKKSTDMRIKQIEENTKQELNAHRAEVAVQLRENKAEIREAILAREEAEKTMEKSLNQLAVDMATILERVEGLRNLYKSKK